MKTKLTIFSLLTVVFCNTSGMEDVGFQTREKEKGEQESYSRDVKKKRKETSKSCRDLSDAVLSHVAASGEAGKSPTLQALQELSSNRKSNSSDIKDLVAQQWMTNSPVFEKLCDYCPFVEQKKFDNFFKLGWSPSDKQVAITFNNNNKAELWDLETSQSIHTFENVNPHSINWSPSGKQLAIRYYSHQEELWDLETNQSIHTFENVEKINWSPSEKQIVITFRDKKAKLWDLETNQYIQTFDFDNVDGIYWSPSGRQVAIRFKGEMFKGGKAELWDLETNQSIQSFDNVDSLFGINWSPSGKQVAIRFNDGKAELWDLETKQSIQSFDNVNYIDWSPSGKQIAIKYYGHKIELWDFEQNQSIHTFENVDIFMFRWSASEKQVLIEYYGRKTELWDLVQNQSIQTFDNVDYIDWRNPSDKQIVIEFDNTDENSVKLRLWLWDSEKQVVITFRNSGGKEKLWEVAQNKSIQSLDDFGLINWSPSGKQLAIKFGDIRDNSLLLLKRDESAVNELRKISTCTQALALEKVNEILSSPRSFAEKKSAIEALKSQNDLGPETINKVCNILGE